MEPRETTSTLLAGVLGTLAMVVAERLTPQLSRMEEDLARLASGLVTEDERLGRVLRAATPFVVGPLFAFAYAGLWKRGVGRPDWRSAVVFGLVHGGATIAAKPLFRLAHPRPFDLPSGPVWVAGELLDHLVYAVATARAYAALTKKPKTP